MAQQPKPLDPAASARALFGYQMRTLREAKGQSLDELGQHLFLSRAALGTYERGRSLPPDPATVAALDGLLDGRGLLLATYRFAIGPHGDSHGDSSDPARAGRPAQGTIGFMTEPDDTLEAAAREAAAFGAWAERAGTGDVELALIHQHVRTIAHDVLRRPPAQMIEAAAPLAARVYALARSHQHPRHSRELHLLAAQLCSLMAWLSGDVGRHDAAELHASAAFACAQVADDPATTAWSLVVGSKTAFWREDYTAAADRANRADRQEAPGTAAVMLACQRADAYSKLGDAPRTRRALEAARTAADAAGPDPVGGLLSCGPVRALNYAAAALLAIGEAHQAVTQAELALDAAGAGGIEQLGFGTIAQTCITRALAYAAAGDPEGAREAARPVLELPPERRLATLAARIAPLAHQPCPPRLRSSAATALAQEVTAFCATAPPTPHPQLAPAPEDE